MGGKRGNGEGSIFQLGNGKWRGVFTVGMNAKGRPIRRSVTAKTRSAAVLRMAEKRKQLDSGSGCDTTAETVEVFLTRWIDCHITAHKAESTAALYRLAAKNHIFPRIGHVAIKKLTPAMCQAFADQLVNENASSRMRQVAFSVFVRGLKHARKLKVLADLPTEGISPPKHSKEEIFPLDAEQAAKAIKVSEGTRAHLPIVLGLACGMRIGEILGLPWDAVDLKKKTLRIAQQAVEVNGKAIIRKPKTKSSIRTIQLPAVAVRAFIAHRAMMLAAGLAGSDLACPAPGGQVDLRTNFSRRHWAKVLKKIGAAHRGFHHARHTYATLALGSGVPVHVVARVLGHNKASTTLDVYAHVLQGQQDQATTAINRLFG